MLARVQYEGLFKNTGGDVAVLKIVEYLSKDTIATLRVLLSMALKGQLRGLAIYYRTEDGSEETVFTGIYKAHAADAATAGMRLSVSLLRASGELE